MSKRKRKINRKFRAQKEILKAQNTLNTVKKIDAEKKVDIKTTPSQKDNTFLVKRDLLKSVLISFIVLLLIIVLKYSNLIP